MLVGVCQLELLIISSISLKDKRAIIKSILDRIKSRYNVSIAEVEEMDLWNKSIIGFAQVSNNKNHLEYSLRKVINFIDNDYRVEIIKEYIEII